MIEELKIRYAKNNEMISTLKQDYIKNFKKDININIYEIPEAINEEELGEIIQKQRHDINYLNTLIDIEMQNIGSKIRNKIEALKYKETDKNFSNFYRTGSIVIKEKEISINNFYIREFIDKNQNKSYQIICEDEDINKNIFSFIYKNNDDTTIELYNLKDSKIFYDMYQDKELYTNNKIILDTDKKIEKFKKYLNNWKNEKHNMVAEQWINISE